MDDREHSNVPGPCLLARCVGGGALPHGQRRGSFWLVETNSSLSSHKLWIEPPRRTECDKLFALPLDASFW